MSEAKNSPEILPIVLCGGSGTRLWPLSRKAYPKQFVPLLNGKSLLELTLERVKPLSSGVLTVTSHEHRFLAQEAAEAAGVSARHLLEPVARNTAAAMAVGALNAHPDQLVLFLPADHHIPDSKAFIATVVSGVPAARKGYIVTFGILPVSPATAYGYIQQGEALEVHGWNVKKFIEKPNQNKAQQLLLAGGYFWNAGIFLVQASTLIEALSRHAPAILANARLATKNQTIDGPFIRLDPAAFSACPSDSFDYAVLEHHDKTAMIPFSGQWSDVGSWNAIAELTAPDQHNNRVVGHGWALQSSNTYINAPHRAVVALGTENLLIIDTPDALLVAAASHAEQVKDVVARLRQDGLPQAAEHRRVARPWGQYDCVDAGARFQVKRLTVKPGGKLSLQLHNHRAEHWVVVQGTARVTRGEDTYLLNENESTYIPVGVKHRLENPGTTPLEMIEVQTGTYLDESDIVRFEDKYGRE